MSHYSAALDQGTTSTHFIIFDHKSSDSHFRLGGVKSETHNVKRDN